MTKCSVLPSQSPDLSPMENLCTWLNKQTYLVTPLLSGGMGQNSSKLLCKACCRIPKSVFLFIHFFHFQLSQRSGDFGPQTLLTTRFLSNMFPMCIKKCSMSLQKFSQIFTHFYTVFKWLDA